MTKYRVREQNGVFYIEKKVWLLGWVPVYDINHDKQKSFLSLEQAFAFIERMAVMASPDAPVYHYLIKGSTAPVEPHRED